MKRRLLAFALLFTLAPAASYAQGGGGDDPTTKAARARFQEGVDFFDKGQYENARAAFLQAYALKKHPSLLLNLAQSCAKSNHYVEAAKFFQQYLRESTGLTPAQKADAEKGLADARSKVGRLDIQAGAGSEIFVDNERIGVTPLAEPLEVDTGPHAVRIKGGEGSSEQRVTVAGGQVLAVKFGSVSPTPTPQPKVDPTPTPTPTTDPTPTPTPTTDNGTTATMTAPPPDTTTPTGPKPKTGLYLAVGGGVVAIAGFTIAGIFAGLKSAANDKLNSNIALIKTNNGGSFVDNKGTPVCSSKQPAYVAKFGTACNTVNDNTSAVNQDATVANIGIAVGIVGAATAVGGVVWFLVSKPKAQTSGIQLVPWIGSETSGMSVLGTF
jgi:hypothetical protein